MTVKIGTVAHVPDDLVNKWLQHLRDFDTAHPGCHFEVLADTPSWPLRDVIELLRISPQLDIVDVFPREKPQ